MSAMTLLVLSAAAFVATHLGLAGPARHALAKRLGEKGYLALYMFVAFGTLGAMAHFYSFARADAVPLWTAGHVVWILASAGMWLASILFVGSLRRKPAFPNPGAPNPAFPERAEGVYAITRHPMMWAFALWALVHVLVNPTIPSFMLSAAVAIVAIAGAAAQDERKALTIGEPFRDWQARTAFLPFARGADWPSGFAAIGGTILFFGATFAHQHLAAIPAGIWRYL